MRNSSILAVTALLAVAPFAGRASDGVTDSLLAYPAVAGYYEFFVYLPAGEIPVVAYAEESCTATLISSKVMLTASHCTAYNYTEDVGIAGYSSEVWVSFDVTATANDFRCFLAESGVQYSEYLTGEYACDVTQRTAPRLRSARRRRRDAATVLRSVTASRIPPTCVRRCARMAARSVPSTTCRMRPTWVRSYSIRR